MGIIRGGLLGIVGLALFICFLAGAIFLTFDLSLKYEKVSPQVNTMVNELMEEVTEGDTIYGFDKDLATMVQDCQNSSEYVQELDDEELVIPCDVILEGKTSLINYTLSKFVERAYYQEYNCDFWDCLKKTGQPIFLFSEKAKDYWHGKFYSILVVSIFLLVAMFFLVEHKPNFLIISGAILTLVSLLFRELKGVFSLIDKNFAQFFNIFFSQAGVVFLITIIIGIITLALGVIFRILRWGHQKQKLSKEDVKGIVQQEVKKVKQGQAEVKPKGKKK